LLPQLPKALNQAENGTNIPKMRVFYEHFCRNDRRSIIFTTQNSLLLLSEFSACRSKSTTVFLFAFFGHFLAFFFLERKRERK